MNLKYIFTTAIFLSGLYGPVQAASLFDNVTLEGAKGPHLVTKNRVNVRAKPANTGKKLSKLQKRDVVNVLGRAKGTQWLAVRRDAKDLGYVFANSLTPMIDGSFEGPLVGKIDLTDHKKPTCRYEVTYEGRAMEDDIVFVSADYLAFFKCRMNDENFDFNAMLFMSEIPHDLGRKPIYQITINLPDIATGYEEFLSATALYHQHRSKVVMDAVSLKAFKEKDLRQTKEALTPVEAIESALALQLDSFNTKAWRTIAGEIPSPGDKKPE
ncbi:SH3 domain-containing protein [Terasakiella sp. A23]|uniref:SH3 domain-containing protein n=1 Tax=Terasakiella sp. FCG-A23 TaxID=3080561 RepID=UPI0029554920|nr:SH3 domain-containing protein [Terasakiella sp. A23]MDV7341678.1 SH3 domain-containing protein [Terasakiella sp. A23]